jgi:hypothetical protein
MAVQIWVIGALVGLIPCLVDLWVGSPRGERGQMAGVLVLSPRRYHRGAECCSGRGMPEVSAGSSARIAQPSKIVSISSRLAPGGSGLCLPGAKASCKSVAPGAAVVVTAAAGAWRGRSGQVVKASHVGKEVRGRSDVLTPQ